MCKVIVTVWVGVFAALPVTGSGQSISGGYVTVSEKRAESVAAALRADSTATRQTLRALFGASANPHLPDLIFLKDYRRVDDSGRVVLIRHNNQITELFSERYLHLITCFIEPVAQPDSPKPAPEIDSEEKEFTMDSLSQLVYAQLGNQKVRETTFKITAGESGTDTTVIVTLLSKKATPKRSVKISLTQLGYRRRPSELNVVAGIKALAGTLTGALGNSNEPETPTRDTSFTLELESIGVFKDPLASPRDSLTLSSVYFAHTKIPLTENAVFRVTARDLERKFAQTATFGNYSASLIGLSVGLINMYVDDATIAREQIKKTSLDAYILVQLYLKRQNRPTPHFVSRIKSNIWHKPYIALTFGIQIKDSDIFDDLFVGATWGQLIGPLGVSVGVSSRYAEDIDNSRRIWHKAAGIVFDL